MMAMLDILSFSAVASALATIVSCASIVLAYATYRLNRRQAHRSVRPIANLWPADHDERITVTLQNNGVGPMLIGTLLVRNISTQQHFINLVDAMPSPPADVSFADYVGVFSDKVLSPSREIAMLNLVGKRNDPSFCEFRDTVRQTLSQLSVEVTYEDVYGNKQPRLVKSLEWYSRTNK